jgi:deoxyribonuclease V
VPIAVCDIDSDAPGSATAACVVLRSFDSSESLEERVVRLRQAPPGASRSSDLELLLLRAALDALVTDVQVVVIRGYVWLGGTTRPGLGARLYQALRESVSVLGIAEARLADGKPDVLEIARGRNPRPLFVTSVGFPPPVVGKLVRAMHGGGRLPWAMARAAALSGGREPAKRFHRRASHAGARAMRRLPRCARLNRTLWAGNHEYLEVLPEVTDSPALHRISPDPRIRQRLVERAVVQIRGQRGYAFVDVETPCIVLSEAYYRKGSHLDLYMDLLHELTHLRQLTEGFDLWDDRFEYVDRPTEVEGYAVAIEEGRRLGMTERDAFQHLSNPWMTEADTRRLIAHIDTYLDGGELPNIALARQVSRRKAWRPW